MQDSNIKVQKSTLNEIDSALKELGMLATSTNSREEYLRENMMTINTKFVRNIQIGFCKLRKMAPHTRFKPYTTRRERTRSENNDVEAILSSSFSLSQTLEEEYPQLKRAKSLESIIREGENDVSFDNMELNFPELEVVSNSIQNLRVAE